MRTVEKLKIILFSTKTHNKKMDIVVTVKNRIKSDATVDELELVVKYLKET